MPGSNTERFKMIRMKINDPLIYKYVGILVTSLCGFEIYRKVSSLQLAI